MASNHPKWEFLGSVISKMEGELSTLLRERSCFGFTGGWLFQLEIKEEKTDRVGSPSYILQKHKIAHMKEMVSIAAANWAALLKTTFFCSLQPFYKRLIFLNKLFYK